MLELATRNASKNPYFVAINLTAKINRLLGSELHPWELEHMPEDWLEAILRFMDGPDDKMIEGHRKIERIKAKIRAEHKSYGARLRRKARRG